MTRTTAFLTALIFHTSLHAQLIDFTSGGNGTFTGVGQSYNESRAADVTVISPVPINITSMTAKHLFSGNDNSIIVGARIFDATTHALLLAHDTTLGFGYNFNITIPVSYSLMPGVEYRIGFFCGGIASDNTGIMYQPIFPYNDSNNLLQINSGKESLPDTFPGNMNIFIPVISMTYNLGSGTGLQSMNISDDLYFYPNPFNNALNIDAEGSELNVLTVFDFTGRKIMQYEFNSEVTLNTTSLPPGFYLCELLTKDGRVRQKKLVKQ